jgi:hypothetical protein
MTCLRREGVAVEGAGHAQRMPPLRSREENAANGEYLSPSTVECMRAKKIHVRSTKPPAVHRSRPPLGPIFECSDSGESPKIRVASHSSGYRFHNTRVLSHSSGKGSSESCWRHPSVTANRCLCTRFQPVGFIRVAGPLTSRTLELFSIGSTQAGAC